MTNTVKKDLIEILKVCLVLGICFLVTVYFLPNRAIAGINPHTYIPTKAYTYCPLVKQQQEQYFKLYPDPKYFCGLAEQESCASLTSPKCWSPTSKLSTSRELGLGIFQLTQAYDKTGKVRFDSLSDMVRLHNKELHDLSWTNITIRPDLQIRSMLLMSSDNYKALYNIKDARQREYFTDSAYNAGVGAVYKTRRLCSLTKGCNSQVWFNTETDAGIGCSSICAISQKPIYGTSSPCSINHTHVNNVFNIRMNKYQTFFNNKE